MGHAFAKHGSLSTCAFADMLFLSSSQHDIFSEVMNPLVDEFLGGKSGLLIAMGPTGSGKTHTVFGSPRNPGIVPLTLHQIFSARDESKGGSQQTRYTTFWPFYHHTSTPCSCISCAY